MKYGHFDDNQMEYVIHTPQTPLPWINYLGSENFFTLISNTAGGYSFYKDARLRRLTRYRYNNSPLDSEGYHIYMKDEKDIWNAGWQPTQTPLDSYCCRHGLGYTVIESAKNNIETKQEMFVPINDNCLLIRLTVTNHNSTETGIDVFPYTEFCLWDAMDDASNFQRNFSIGEVEVTKQAIYHKSEYRERRNHYSVFWSNEAPDAYDTSRDSFIGIYGSPAKPEAVMNGKCSNSIASGWAPVAAMQMHLSLAPNESKSFIFGLGYIENAPNEKWEAANVINKDKAKQMMDTYHTNESFDEALDALAARWQKLLSHFQLRSDNDKVNRMVNIWHQYQCMVTFNMSRSASYYESGMGRGMGFRDSCQDLLGFVHMIPERARERILDIAATQFPDGSAYHQYQPLTKKGNLAVGSGFNDDPLWLIACTDAYIRETGDWDILKESVPFDNNEDLAAPLMEHLRRSFNYTTTHLGPHKLPLIGRADWNDCLNLNCFSAQPGECFQVTGPSEGPVAESIFIGGMFVKYGKSYVQICQHLHLTDEADVCLKQINAMETALLSDGWDGEWFKRAYDAYGDPVGSKVCDEGKIFIEPQGMCVMAGVGKDSGEALASMESVKKHLDTKYGIVLLQPPFTSYKLNLGEISSYPPGYKENAGIFCHNNPWIVCAETVLGRGNRAFEVYRRTCPAYTEEISEIHRTEPYVYSQMIAGKDAARFGEAKNSWLTGTAAWTFLSISQAILGIQPTLDGLTVDPCIPSDMQNFSVERIYRGATYHITVDNTAGVEHGVKEIYINDNKYDSSILPVAPAGSEVNVKIVMG